MEAVVQYLQRACEERQLPGQLIDDRLHYDLETLIKTFTTCQKTENQDRYMIRPDVFVTTFLQTYKSAIKDKRLQELFQAVTRIEYRIQFATNMTHVESDIDCKRQSIIFCLIQVVHVHF